MIDEELVYRYDEELIPQEIIKFYKKTKLSLNEFIRKLEFYPEKLSKLMHFNLRFRQSKKLIKTIRDYCIPVIIGREDKKTYDYLSKMYTKKRHRVKSFLESYKSHRIGRSKTKYPRMNIKKIEKLYFEDEYKLEKYIDKSVSSIYNDKYLRSIKKTFTLPEMKSEHTSSFLKKITKSNFFKNLTKSNKLENKNGLEKKIYHLSIFDYLRTEHLKSDPDMFKAKIYAIIDAIDYMAELLKLEEVPALVEYGDSLVKILDDFGSKVLNKTVNKLLKNTVYNTIAYTAFIIGDNTPIEQVETTKQDYSNFWKKINSVIQRNVKQVLDNKLRLMQEYESPIVIFNQPIIGPGIKDLTNISEKRLEDILITDDGVSYLTELIGHGNLEFVSRQVQLPARIGIPDIILKRTDENLYYIVELKNKKAIPKDLMQTGSYMHYFMNYINKEDSYKLKNHELKKITGLLLTTSLPKKNESEFIKQAKNLGIQLRVFDNELYKLIKDKLTKESPLLRSKEKPLLE